MVRPRISLRYLLVAGALLGLGIAGLAAWGSSRLQSRAQAELLRVLSAASGAQARVGSTELDLGRGLLVARTVELADGARVMLRATELRGHVKLASSLTGRLELEGLELRGVTATLTVADLRRLGAELDRSAMRGELRLPAAELTLALGELGVLRAERTDLTVVRTGDARRIAMSRARVHWIYAGQTAVQAQLAWACDVQGDGARTTCEPKLDALEIGGQTWTSPVLGKLAIDPTRGAIEGELAVRDGSTDLALRYVVGLRGALGAAGGGHVDLQLVTQRVRLGAAAGQPALFAVPQLTLTAELGLDGSKLAAERLRLKLPRGALTGRAQIAQGGSFSVELDSELLDLADFESLAGVAVAGRGRVQIRARTAGPQPECTVSVALDAAAVGGVALGRLTAEMTLDAGAKQLRIERAQMIAPERQLVASGARLAFDASGLTSADAQLQVQRLPLAELYRLIGAGADPLLAHLQARSAGTATLSYKRVGGKGGLALDLNLQLTAAGLADYPFERGQLRARIALADARQGMSAGVFELHQLSLYAGGGTLELTGKLDRGGLAMHLATRGDAGLPLERWPWLRAHAPAFGGGLRVAAALSGTTSQPRADLELAIDSLAFRGQALGQVSLAAHVSDRVEPLAGALLARCRSSGSALGLTPARGWRICGEGLRGQLRMDVAVGDAPERAMRGQLELDRLSLSPFLPPSAAGKPTPGVFSGTFALTAGSASQPDRLSGRVQVRELAVGEGELRIASAAPFQLQIRAGQLELRDAIVTGREQHYTLGAEGSLGNKPRLIADGTIGAGIFTRTTEPFVKAFGDVGVRLEWNVTGTPALTGRADLRDLAVRVGNTTVRNLRGSFAVAGEHVALSGVTAAVGGGRVDVSGQLGLAGLRLASYDLGVKAERFALQPDPLIDVELDAQNRLRWTGGAATPELSGHVKIKRLVYRKQLHPETLANLGQKTTRVPAADRLLFDLTIEQEQPMHIRNSLIDGELSCAGADRSLRVLGSDRRFGVVGQLAVTRGRLLFQGDEFLVQRGTIDFRDPKRIAPRFDLLAVAERKRRPDARVVLSASGSDESFEVDVRCETPEPVALPPPFNCRYAGAKMQCDDFDQLVALFVCKQGAPRTAAKLE